MSRDLLLSLIFVGVTALLALASLSTGYVDLSRGEILTALLGRGPADTITIVQELRLPRVLLALLLGASLGGAGAVLQGLLRNPLAEPSTLGISGAASFGAVIALYFGLSQLGLLWLPACAMIGALFATALLLWLSRHGLSILTLILIGVGINGISIALTSLAMNLSPTPWAVSEIAMWLLGSLRDRTFTELRISAPFIVAGMILMVVVGRRLDSLALGEDTAQSLGMNLQQTRLFTILGTSIAVGAGVAVSGSVGFVGLMMPHLMRPIFGHRPSAVIIPSMIGGAALVVAADTLVRVIAVGPELQLGVLTSLVGVPFYIYLVLHLRRQLS